MSEPVGAHLERVYGTVPATVHTVALPHLSTQDLVDASVTSGELEIAPEGYAFWNPWEEWHCSHGANRARI